jgi:hypothetical protein
MQLQIKSLHTFQARTLPFLGPKVFYANIVYANRRMNNYHNISMTQHNTTYITYLFNKRAGVFY